METISRVIQVVILTVFFATVAVLAAQVKVDPAPVPAPAPLTELESLKVQNLNLKTQLLNKAYEEIQQQKSTLKTEIEKARPGFAWDPETGTFTPTPLPKK